MGKTILMKVTSRERPDILLETVRQYVAMANNTEDMVWLFSFDVDCECSSTYFENKLLKLFIYPKNVSIIRNVSYNKINAINRDVSSVTDDWQILLNISDDQRPILKGYDDIIRNAMPDHLDASLWFSDGQPRVNTQEIVGREYYKRFNCIYHPDYKSLWCDNEATEVAFMLDKQIKSKQQIIKHYHPAWGGSESIPNDELYKRNNKFWNEDEATFKRRKQNNFDLR